MSILLWEERTSPATPAENDGLVYNEMADTAPKEEQKNQAWSARSIVKSLRSQEDESWGIEGEELSKGGPYVGPRGGKWADAKHTIPWKEGKAPASAKSSTQDKQTAPERIRAWVEKNFAGNVYADAVIQDLIGIAAGNRKPNSFEAKVLKNIFPSWPDQKSSQKTSSPVKEGKAPASAKSSTQDKQTAPERIRAWVEKEFASKHVDSVTNDLIASATGNRKPNSFEASALKKIFPTWSDNKTSTKSSSGKKADLAKVDAKIDLLIAESEKQGTPEERLYEINREVAKLSAESNRIYTSKVSKSMNGLSVLEDYLQKAGGPFIGPKGGKWADSQHTIPWKETGAQAGPAAEEKPKGKRGPIAEKDSGGWKQVPRGTDEQWDNRIYKVPEGSEFRALFARGESKTYKKLDGGKWEVTGSDGKTKPTDPLSVLHGMMAAPAVDLKMGSEKKPGEKKPGEKKPGGKSASAGGKPERVSAEGMKAVVAHKAAQAKKEAEGMKGASPEAQKSYASKKDLDSKPSGHEVSWKNSKGETITAVKDGNMWKLDANEHSRYMTDDIQYFMYIEKEKIKKKAASKEKAKEKAKERRDKKKAEKMKGASPKAKAFYNPGKKLGSMSSGSKVTWKSKDGETVMATKEGTTWKISTDESSRYADDDVKGFLDSAEARESGGSAGDSKNSKKVKKSMSGLDNLGEFLEKARYTKRTGSPGSYKYEYENRGEQKREKQRQSVEEGGKQGKAHRSAMELRDAEEGDSQESKDYRRHLTMVLHGNEPTAKTEGAKRAHSALKGEWSFKPRFRGDTDPSKESASTKAGNAAYVAAIRKYGKDKMGRQMADSARDTAEQKHRDQQKPNPVTTPRKTEEAKTKILATFSSQKEMIAAGKKMKKEGYTRLGAVMVNDEWNITGIKPSKVEKSMTSALDNLTDFVATDHEPLSKGLLSKGMLGGYGMEWANRFMGTPFEVDALQCLKNLNMILAERAEVRKNHDKNWRERQDLSAVARAKHGEKMSKMYAKCDAKEDAERKKQSDLEEKYLDWRIEKAKETKKSDPVMVAGDEVLEKSETKADLPMNPQAQDWSLDSEDRCVIGGGVMKSEGSLDHDRALAADRLRKGEEEIHPFSVAAIHGDSDKRAVSLTKGGAGEADPRNAIISNDVLCKSCGGSHAAMLTACPGCGYGAIGQEVMAKSNPGIILEDPRGAPILRRPKTQADISF